MIRAEMAIFGLVQHVVFVCDLRKSFWQIPEVTTQQGPGNPAPVSRSPWAQVLTWAGTPVQLQPAAGCSCGLRSQGGGVTEAWGGQGV